MVSFKYTVVLFDDMVRAHFHLELYNLRYSGKSPYYYDNSDISRIAMYDRTLFARKVSGNKKSRKLIKSVKKWIDGERPEFRVKLEFKMTCRGLCLGYIGSLMTDWIGCRSEMTYLQAYCIGNLCLIRPKLDGGVMLASHSDLASPGGMVLFGRNVYSS